MGLARIVGMVTLGILALGSLPSARAGIHMNAGKLMDKHDPYFMIAATCPDGRFKAAFGTADGYSALTNYAACAEGTSACLCEVLAQDPVAKSKVQEFFELKLHNLSVMTSVFGHGYSTANPQNAFNQPGLVLSNESPCEERPDGECSLKTFAGWLVNTPDSYGEKTLEKVERCFQMMRVGMAKNFTYIKPHDTYGGHLRCQ